MVSGRRHTVNISKPVGGGSLLNSNAMRRVQILAGVSNQNDQNEGSQKRLDGPGGPAVIHQQMSESERASLEKRSSIMNARADGSISAASGGQFSHSGTLISRTVTEKMLQLERGDSLEIIEDIPLVEKPKAKWKIAGEKLLENYKWIGMMSVVTIYALFADDCRILFMPKSVDPYLDALTILAIMLYLIELVLGVTCVEKYFMSFYFWVDAISLLSMFPDVSFILEAFEGGIGGAGGEGADIAKTGRASKVIKIVRIIRLIRLLRVVKLYKQVKTGQKVKNQKI